MENSEKIAVIIAAAGRGSRLGESLPKQFLKLGEKEILEHTLGIFKDIEDCDVFLSLPEEFVVSKKEQYGVMTVAGGATRQESVSKALEMVNEEIYKWVMVHDGARPFLSCDLLERIIKCMKEKGSAIPVIEVKDTIKEIRSLNMNGTENIVLKTYNRSTLGAVQTPQAFKLDTFKRAMKKAVEDGFEGTDEAGLIERMGETVYTVTGEQENFKITTSEDLAAAKALIKERNKESAMVENILEEKIENNNFCEGGTNQGTFEDNIDKKMDFIRYSDMGKMRIGKGFDVHKIISERKMVIGGVTIPSDKGLLGHSDADVLVHAIIDAVLGAAGLPDIGQNFPDTKEEFKDISSIKLLEKVNELIREKGITVINIDSTVIGERPRIAPYREQMIANIASALKIPEDRVNVKGTTTEKLGFTGREEGVAAEAVVLLTF